MITTSSPKRQVISLLDADPDLAADIAAEDLPLARRHARATVFEARRPVWDPGELGDPAGACGLGVFVLGGLLIRRVTVGRRSACELCGPGDLFRPWDADDAHEPLPVRVDWVVLEPARLAVLDDAFALRVARWPALTCRLMARLACRARHLALAQAATHLPRAYTRLLILFWLLAERWGTVSPAGVHITLPLTHEILAMLVGAHRPTVSIAVQRLERAGLLHRESRDRWLLSTRAIKALEDPDHLELIDDECALS